MSDTNTNIENLILEHLKRFQAGQDRIEGELREIKARLGNLEASTASVKRDVADLYGEMALQNSRYDRISDRIERIERRLEIA